MTRALFSQTTALRQRIMAGGAWTTVGFGVGQGVRLVGNLVMTRLIVPEAFGLMALTTAIFIWLGMLTDFGVNASIIRSKEADRPEFLATAWTLQVGRDLLIAIGFALVSLVLFLLQQNGVTKTGTVYNDPRLCLFLLAMCLSTCISAFRSIKSPIAQRRMALDRLIILEISAQIISLGTMIIAARAGFGVYSLLAGMLAATITSTAGSYIFLQGPPSKFGFHKEHFGEIFHYGKWLLLASMFGFIINRGDQFIFSYFMPAETFSFYAIATIWIGAGEMFFSIIAQRVAYPALSEINRDNPEKLTATYNFFRRIATIGCTIIFAVLFLCSDFIFGILYTDQYAPVSGYMQLLCIMILFLPYRLLNTALLTVGDSRRFMIITILPSFLLISITPLIITHVGIEPAIVFFAMIQLFSIPLSWKFAAPIIKISPVREAFPLIFAIIAALYVILNQPAL